MNLYKDKIKNCLQQLDNCLAYELISNVNNNNKKSNSLKNILTHSNHLHPKNIETSSLKSSHHSSMTNLSAIGIRINRKQRSKPLSFNEKRQNNERSCNKKEIEQPKSDDERNISERIDTYLKKLDTALIEEDVVTTHLSLSDKKIKQKLNNAKSFSLKDRDIYSSCSAFKHSPKYLNKLSFIVENEHISYNKSKRKITNESMSKTNKNVPAAKNNTGQLNIISYENILEDSLNIFSPYNRSSVKTDVIKEKMSCSLRKFDMKINTFNKLRINISQQKNNLELNRDRKRILSESNMNLIDNFYIKKIRVKCKSMN